MVGISKLKSKQHSLNLKFKYNYMELLENLKRLGQKAFECYYFDSKGSKYLQPIIDMGFNTIQNLELKCMKG